MTPVRRVTGRAYPLGRANVDTDLIIPAHWMKRMTRDGFGLGAFETLRAGGNSLFDDPRFRGAPILIAGENFGCGSSREHAVWALLDLGIRAIVATGFSDLFVRNAAKNGVIPATVAPSALGPLLDAAINGDLTVDLIAMQVQLPNKRIVPFSIDSARRQCILDGTDDIDLTLSQLDQIVAYEDKMQRESPWA